MAVFETRKIQMFALSLSLGLSAMGCGEDSSNGVDIDLNQAAVNQEINGKTNTANGTRVIVDIGPAQKVDPANPEIKLPAFAWEYLNIHRILGDFESHSIYGVHFPNRGDIWGISFVPVNQQKSFQLRFHFDNGSIYAVQYNSKLSLTEGPV